MRTIVSAHCALLAVVAIAGCNQHANSMFNGPGNAASAPAAVASTQPAPAANVPYVLRAQSAGPYIDFSIYNMGTTDVTVKPEDFALLVPDSRDVIPYDKANAVIDLPQPAVVKPNETLNGRAIFHTTPAPVGKRLVFKPDAVGTFADINRVVGMNAPTAAPAPAASSAVMANAPAAGTAPAPAPMGSRLQ